MDIATQARFERTERLLAGMAEALDRNIQTQSQLAETLNHYIDSGNARAERLEDALQTLTKTITRYVDVADARMVRIEQNLDALIRAITSEHTNGKGSH